MRRRLCNATAALAAMSLFTACAPVPSVAKDPLGRILEGGGIALAVSKFGPQVNKFMNNLTGTKGRVIGQVTKVVPIISAGRGVYLGAAQVAGPQTMVKKVKAVAQLEGKFSEFRVKALIPVDTTNPAAKPSRIRGVGVTGLIDVNL